ncbi:tetratricopeptide repeat protein [Pseudenhygromyxa sp. WMMC2535]|uniref:tetratricopeptide repeat protein n=1 Tax=Pseudenhygromyxa sp. WMMC2535 TaxID=2712867 RepID=UPI001554FF82|nr:tetratricopeptide repeat protein [Pseudenhygromyxa sp. WMMC2535]NVB37786.1 tetratricopeptide repeat protein [Pseudenhygromyxa sp. WMMC2535]
MRVQRALTTAIPLVMTLAMAGCITTTAQHEELQREVVDLKKKVSERDTQLQETLVLAQEQMAKVEEQLEKAERLLRDNQATLGVRVDDLELGLADVRGLAEDSQNGLAAISQNIDESRTEVDQRLAALETQIKAETDIPEGKSDLLRAAEQALSAKEYDRARRLFRTYLSRYPADAKEAEVRFEIGQTLFAQRDYRSALGEFYWLVQNAPDSEVIHDAVYYSGLAFAKLGQCDKSVAYFQAIIKDGSGAPERYQKQAKKQIETLEKDDGKICTDRRDPEAEAEAGEPAS